ncbi:hypothetical protein C0Q70_05783 [Pomacea canaliculata]|uniref:Uncharacterized protein n=1 Tax=Pomacea canaliculata TaxID=400727 RepID=A0A2T7PM51_POMCA|nr:hypothetical protein C0Q70_05783 [Pomacea canaliculata]
MLARPPDLQARCVLDSRGLRRAASDLFTKGRGGDLAHTLTQDALPSTGCAHPSGLTSRAPSSSSFFFFGLHLQPLEVAVSSNAVHPLASAHTSVAPFVSLLEACPDSSRMSKPYNRLFRVGWSGL